MASFERYSDAQLVALVQSSDNLNAFDALLGRHHAYLKKFLHALAGSRAHDVEDILQETLIKAFTHIATFRYDAEFSTWLLRIGRNEFLQARRKQNVFQKLRTTFWRLGDSETAQRDTTAAAIDVDASLRTLSDRDRLILVYCDALGFSHQEAAAELALPLGTIKSSLARARKLARQHFEVAPSGDGSA